MSDPVRAFFRAHAPQLMDRARCSRRDKTELVEVARAVVLCCDRARREGLLSLDTTVEELADPQLAGAFRCFVDGWDPVLWAETLVLQMLADAPRGKVVFKGLIILLGAADLHERVDPAIVEHRMRALFGRDADLLDYHLGTVK